MRRIAAALIGLAFTAPAFAEEDPAAKPDVVAFESSVAAITAALEPLCASLEERAIEEVQFPDAESQTQVDCEGFAYAGAPRKAEFMFADDALKFVWILVEPDDLDGLTAAFTARYGAPTHATSDFSAYADDRAAVRYDTPEAAFYAASVDEPMRAQLDGMVAAAAEASTE